MHRRLLPLLLLACAVLTGCDLRAASQAQIDVCALAAPPLAEQVPSASAIPGRSQPPQAGSCQFNAPGQDGKPVRVQVSLYTYAAARQAEQARLENLYRISLAEAGANAGGEPTRELADLSGDSAVFGLAAGGSGQLMLLRRGVLLEVGCHGLSREQAVALTRRLWQAVEKF